MRILFLGHRLPAPLSDGYNLHNHHYLLRLGRRHEVDVLSYADGGLAPELARVLGEVETVAVHDGPAHNPLRRAIDAFSESGLHHFHAEFDAALRARLARVAYDVVWFGGSLVTHYVRSLGARDAGGPAVVFDPADDEVRASRIALERAKGPAQRLRRYREWVCNRKYQSKYFPLADLCLFVSEEDAAAVRRRQPGLRIETLHNGTDSTYFAPRPGAAEPATLVFEGTMSFEPNAEGAVHLVRDVLPLVRKKIPGARVVLVGRDPGPEVRSLAGPGVEVTGTVADVRSHLARGAVFVCPLVSGTGIKNKILQAWSMEVPVVATPVSVTGLGATHGEDILIAEGAPALADACAMLLRAPEVRRRLGAAGRERVLAHYGWDAQAARLERWLEELSAARATQPSRR